MQRHHLLLLALPFLLAACGAGFDAPTTFTVPGTSPSSNPATSPAPDGGATNPGAAPVDAGAAATPQTNASESGIFPPDSYWNTRIDSAAVDPNSDAYIASMGANGSLVASWDESGNGLPYVEVAPDQQKVPVSFWGFPNESDQGPYPIPWNAPVQPGTDGHVLVVDRGNGWLYELFQASRNSDGSWQASNGAKWNLRADPWRPLRWTSADAAGMPVFPGVVRYDEVQSGWIPHALRFAVNWSQKGFVWPANHAAGSCAVGSNCPPMGLRVRLKQSVDISGFSSRMQVILTALKQYGMFVADNTGSNDSWWLAGAPDPGWSDQELLTLGALHGRDFEVVANGDIQPQ